MTASLPLPPRGRTVVHDPTEEGPELLFREARTPIERTALACAIGQTAAAPAQARTCVSLDTVIDLMVEDGYHQFDVRVAVQTLADRKALVLNDEAGEIWISLGTQYLTEARA